MYKNITPDMIVKGMFELDRQTLSSFIAVFEDAKATRILTDKFKNIKNATSKIENIDNFSLRNYNTSQEINNSTLSDDDLRIALLLCIVSSFQIDFSLLFAPRELIKSLGILSSDVKDFMVDKNSKNKFIKKLFGKKDTSSFEDVVMDVVTKIIETSIQDKIIKEDDLKTHLSKLGVGAIDTSDIKSMTDRSIKTVSTLGAGLGGVAVATQLSGFSAYILAANLSSIIPLVGGQTMVSLLAVIANPIFVILALGAASTYGANNLTLNVKKTFASVITSVLAVRGVLSSKDLYNEICPIFLGIEERVLNLKKQNILKWLDVSVFNSLETGVISPSLYKKSFLSDKIVNNKNDKDLIHSIIFPDIDNKEDIALATITFGDFIYDLASIDPDVVKAADFARTDNIASAFDFAKFSEGLEGLPIKSLMGHKVNLMGYTAERIVASKLVDKGHIVSLPETSNQAGFDLLVDGKEFQVKCIKPESFSILEEHFTKYPDIPVFVNSEIHDVLIGEDPDWIDQVFFLEGYSHNFTSYLVDQAIEAGQDLGDYEIVSAISIISFVKNIHSWWRGQQSLGASSFNVLVDAASKGSMSILGGFAGAGIGALMFGPAGAYILGGVTSFAGAVKGRHIVNKYLDNNLFPERESKLTEAANNLITSVNMNLKDKICMLDNKIEALYDSDIGLYVKNRFEWEKVFIQGSINKNNKLFSSKIKGLERADLALRIASDSGLHSCLLQKEYKEILSIMSIKVDRFDAIKNKSKQIIDKINDKF